MIIRSQNKEDLMLMDDISIVRKGDFKDITSAYAVVCYRHGTHCVLGEYSTKEKAIKVLDKIMEHYDKVMDARYWNDAYQDNYFQMPQDSEV